jgi:hypothetical protein
VSMRQRRLNFRAKRWTAEHQVRRAKRWTRATWAAAERPAELHAYLAWDDEWRSRILDALVDLCGGDPRAFAAGAVVILAGYQAGYDG